MDSHPLLTSLESDCSVFGSIAATASSDDDPAVPCCPGWTVRDLVTHVGALHSLVARWVTDGRRPDEWDSEPAAGQPLEHWLRDCSARLLDAVGSVDPLTPCSTWSPYDQSVGFWVRRMAHETLVHRVDLEQSLGLAWEVDELVAVDGIDEALTLWLGSRTPPGLRGSRRCVRVAAYATEGGLLLDRVIRPYGESLHFSSYEPGSAVDATVDGPASAVWAWCWGRGDDVEVTGDTDAAAELRTILAAAEQ